MEEKGIMSPVLGVSCKYKQHVTFGDIIENDEGLGDYFIACYESILENNMDDFEQFVLYGVDLLDDLCEHHEISINKLEEEIEFLYSVLLKRK